MKQKATFSLLTYLIFLVCSSGFGQIIVNEEILIFKNDVQNGMRAVFTADLDNDGDMDVISASHGDNKIAWYENLDGLGSYGEQNVITTSAIYAWDVYAADLDGDGFADVLSASIQDHKIAWYKNNGDGTFGEQQIISTEVQFVSSVFATDLDGDGDMDVIGGSASSDGLADIAWFENTNGNGEFGTKNVISTEVMCVTEIFASDLDNDGDMDVLSASFEDNKIAWYENKDGEGTFSNQKIITATTPGATSVFAADLDNDGDMDILSTSHNNAHTGNRIAWYENIDNDTIFSEQKIISTSYRDPLFVLAADMDNDNDMDIISGAFNNNLICFENIDGSGDFNTQHVISDSARGVYSVCCSDIDNDGYLDITYSSYLDSKIAWFKNITYTSGIEDDFSNSNSIRLTQNFPNPFNSITTIKYFLPEKMHVNISIYNSSGQKIKELVNHSQVKGYHEIQWDALDESNIELGTGVYFYKLNSGDKTLSKTMSLVR